MKKVNVVKIASLGAMVLGAIGSALSGWANKKEMDKTIKEEVAKALENNK